MESNRIPAVRAAARALVLFACAGVSVLPVRAAPAGGPLIDNERVSVWEGAPPAVAAHDGLSIDFGEAVAVRLVHRGEAPAAGGAHSLFIELKDHPVAPLANTSGYPLAFPRPRAQKLLENERVIVWSYRWQPGEPTPMHFHDKDVVVVFREDTALRSTTPDGQSVLNRYRAGEIRFNPRDRTHTELLEAPTGSAVITELK